MVNIDDGLDTEVFDNMKFDVVIGNPPYQAVHRKASLWPTFIKLAHEKFEARYISLVIPNRWCTHSSNIKTGRVRVYDRYIRRHAIYLNIGECTRHFKTDGKKTGYTPRYFSYYIVDTQKPIDRIATICTPEETFDFDLNKLEFVPLNITSTQTCSIQAKIEKYVKEHGKLAGFVEKSQYTSKPGNTVVFGTGRFVPYHKSPLYFDTGELTASGYNNFTSKVLSVSEGCTEESIKSIFQSKLYRYIGHIFDTKDTYSISFFKNLPCFDLTKVWSDDELFAAIGLNSSDVQYITRVLNEITTAN